MIKNRTRVIITIPLLLVVLVLVAYIGLPYYAPWLANKYLSPYDIKIEKLKFEKLSLDEQSIFVNQLMLDVASSGKFDIQGADIRVNKKEDGNQQRPKQTKSYSLDIHKVKYSPSNSTPSSQPSNTELISLMPSSWLSKVPPIHLLAREIILPMATLKNVDLLANADAIKSQALLTINDPQIKSRLGPFPTNGIPTLFALDNNNNLTLTIGNETDEFSMDLLAKPHIDQNQISTAINGKLTLNEYQAGPTFRFSEAELRFESLLELPVQAINTLSNLENLSIHTTLSFTSKFFITEAPDHQFAANTPTAKTQSKPIEGSVAIELPLHLQLNNAQWQVSVNPQKAPIVAIKRGAESIEVYSETALHLAGNLDKASNRSIDKDSALSIIIKSAKHAPLKANISLPNATFSENGSLDSLSSHLNLSGAITPVLKILELDLTEHDIQLISGAIDLSSKVRYSKPNKIEFDVLKKGLIQAKSLSTGEITLLEPRLNIEKQKTRIDLLDTIGAPPATVTPIKISLQTKLKSGPSISTDQLTLDANVSINQQAFIADFQTSPLEVTFAQENKHQKTTPTYLPPIKMNTRRNLSGKEKNTFYLTVRNICDDILVTGILSQLNEQSALRLDWGHSFTKKATFSKWLNTSMLPVDLHSGEIQGSLNLNLTNGAELTDLSLSIKKGAGLSKVGTFSDVQLSLSSTPVESLQNHAKSLRYQLNASIGQVNTGFEVSNIRFKAEVYEKESEWFTLVQDAQSSIFGGSAKIEQKELKVDDDIQFKVLLDNLELKRIVETQQMQNLNATGTMSGYIPVRIRDGGFSIEDGILKGTTPGKIQFKNPLEDGGGIANQQLKLTLDILKDFDYSKLESEVIFDKKTLTIQSALAGKNAKFENGRPVNLNLNTEIGLAGTFELMRIQTGIHANIEKFVNSKVKASNTTYYCESN